MVKKFVLIGRREDRAVDDFRHHWRTVHAPLAAKIIRKYLSDGEGGPRYLQNHVVETLYDSAGDRWPSYRVDGLAEFYVHPADPPQEARTSGDFNPILEDERNLLAMWTQCVVQNEGSDLSRAGKTKVIFVADRNPDVSLAAFQDVVRAAVSQSETNPEHLCHNWITKTTTREALPTEPFPPDVISEMWFSDDAAAKASVASLGRKISAFARRSLIVRVEEHTII